MPGGWSWTSLGAIAVDMADGPFGSNLKREHYTADKEARIIQLSNIGEAGWREDNTKYTTFVHAETISRSIVSPGNLVIAKMMPAGRAIICPAVEKMYVLSSDAVKYVPSKEIFNKYLLYAINSPVVLNQIHAEVQGVTRARTSIEKLRGYLVPIPPKEEQRRIVNSIDYWLEIIGTIEHNQSFVSASIEKIKAKILEYAIEGKLVPQDSSDEPAIELLKRINPAFKPSDNLHYIDNLPKGWCFSTIGDIFQHNTGKALNGIDREGVMLRYITTSNLYWDRFDLSEERMMPFTEKEQEKCRAQKGDLLVCEGGDIGRAAIWPYEESVMIQNHIHRLRPRTSLSVRFFYYIFYLYKQKGLIGGKGIGIQGLSSRELDKMVIPVPPINEQHRIVTAIEEKFAMLDAIADCC